jgi:hypothetical protein
MFPRPGRLIYFSWRIRCRKERNMFWRSIFRVHVLSRAALVTACAAALVAPAVQAQALKS